MTVIAAVKYRIYTTTTTTGDLMKISNRFMVRDLILLVSGDDLFIVAAWPSSTAKRFPKPSAICIHKNTSQCIKVYYTLAIRSAVVDDPIVREKHTCVYVYENKKGDKLKRRV